MLLCSRPSGRSSTAAMSAATACARSMRRPRSRNSRPPPCTMFSAARPETVAVKRMMPTSAWESWSRLCRPASRSVRRSDSTTSRSVWTKAAYMSTVSRSRRASVRRVTWPTSIAIGPRSPTLASSASVSVTGPAVSEVSGEIRSAETRQLARICSPPRSRASRRVAAEPQQRRTGEPGRAFEPLQVAAQPEEILRDPARQVAGGAADGQRPLAHRRGADDVAMLFVQHPDILDPARPDPVGRGKAAFAHHARQPARQGAPLGPVEHQIEPQHDRPRRQPVHRRRGRERQRHAARGGEACRRRQDSCAQIRLVGGGNAGPALGPGAVGGRPQRPARRIGQHALAGGGIAQPQRRHGGELQLLAEEMPRQRRQEGRQRRRLQQGRPRIVDDADGRRGAVRPSRRARPARSAG